MAFLTLLAMTAAIITLIHVILTLLAMRAAVAPTSCRSSLRTLKTYFKTEFLVTFNITVSFVRQVAAANFSPFFLKINLKLEQLQAIFTLKFGLPQPLFGQVTGI